MSDVNYSKELFMAAGDGDVDLIHKYAKIDGIDFEYQYSAGNTPFTEAVMYNKIGAVKALLEYNVNINHKNNFGSNALHLTNSVEIFTLLIEAGVNYEAVNNNGYSVFDRILLRDKKNQLPMINLLIDNGFVLDLPTVNKALNSKSLSQGVTKLLESKKLDLSQGWQHINEDKIAYIEFEKAINREVTSIFNFNAMTVKEITRNMETNAETSLKFHFSERAVDKNLVLKAMDEHKKNDGLASASNVRNALIGSYVTSTRSIKTQKAK